MNYHYKIKLYESTIFDSISIEGFDGYVAIDLAKKAAQIKAIEKQIKYDRITVYTNDRDSDIRIWDNVLVYRALWREQPYCERCGLPFGKCDAKVILIDNKGVINPLCTYCWDNSTEDERLSFYKAEYYQIRARHIVSLEYGVQDVIDAVKRTK